ncbi:MAG: hypothetical protein ABI811_06910 [Acidobacteriota bacterium]
MKLMLFLAVAGLTFGQTESTYGPGSLPTKEPSQRNIYVGDTDTIFPHIATGGGVGGWETILVLVNMSATTVSFTQAFYGEDGQPMTVSFRTVPDNLLVTTSLASGTLLPNQSFNILLFNNSPVTRVGWSSINYNTIGARLGGYGIFRQVHAPNRVFEALVPLSASDDTTFYMPFDNLEGFATGMAIVNSSANADTLVTLTARGLSGNFLGSKSLYINPRGHVSLNLAVEFPAIAGKAGTIVATGDTARLSAIGLRFNLNGGGAFATIPVMNWPGLF